MVKLHRISQDVLTESKQVGKIYHVCTLDAVAGYIAPKDTLSSSGRYTNQILKRKDAVSFTRDKRFVVQTKRNREADMLIQFAVDGTMLSDKYKVVPYNDFAFGPDGSKVGFSPKELEKEEVVAGKITKFSSYIENSFFCLNFKASFSDNLTQTIKDFNASYDYLSKNNPAYNSKLTLRKSEEVEGIEVKGVFRDMSLDGCRDLLKCLHSVLQGKSTVKELGYALGYMDSFQREAYFLKISDKVDFPDSHLRVFYNKGVEEALEYFLKNTDKKELFLDYPEKIIGYLSKSNLSSIEKSGIVKEVRKCIAKEPRNASMYGITDEYLNGKVDYSLLLEYLYTQSKNDMRSFLYRLYLSKSPDILKKLFLEK